MIRVLRHYLPLRRALLVFSETVLLTAVLGAGMSLHLLEPTPGVIGRLIQDGFSPELAAYRCIFSAFLLSVLCQVAISFNELYDFRISSSRVDRAGRFVGSSGSAIAVSIGAVVLARVWHLERVFDFPGLSLSQLVQTLVFTMLLGFALLYFWRNVFHFALRRWSTGERVLILGAGPAAHSLAAEIAERPDSGYEAVGLLPEPKPDGDGNDAPRFRPADPATERVREMAWRQTADSGETSTLLLEPLVTHAATAEEPGGEGRSVEAPHPLAELVKDLRVDVLVVALEDRRGHLPTEELLRCRLDGIAVMEREALYERITGKLAVEAMRPSYLIFNDGFGRSPRSEFAARTLDLVLATTGVLLTWPLMLATAIAVRLDSPGPILFQQERVGRDGLPFTLVKFRSMRADAEKESGPVWAQSDDPRITRCGRFLRKSRLDELPQLFNILAGDMSLVGPRPERPVFVEDLSRQIPYFRQRHIVKPGLTGWAQINYPYGNTVEDALQKLQFDLFYIKNKSLLFDLSILFNTIKTVLLRRGT